MDYLDALRLVHDIIKPFNYCEIGCRYGESLAFARAPSIGIDPDFRIRRSLRAPTRLFRVTSDEFFVKYDTQELLGAPIDFAFIDGMHLAEYALRDFINLERASHPNGLIAVDDLLPGDIAYTTREMRPGRWTGDVYRIVSILKHYRPELEIRVYDVELKGFGLITGLNPSSTVLLDELPKIEAGLADGRWTLSSVEAIRAALSPRPVSDLEPDLLKLAATRPPKLTTRWGTSLRRFLQRSKAKATKS